VTPGSKSLETCFLLCLISLNNESLEVLKMIKILGFV